MKRLSITLLSFIGCVNLSGQEALPMMVAGKMQISGPVYSKGSVHVYAKTDLSNDGNISIDNGIGGATAVLKTDEIILYSNAESDGLLRNANTSIERPGGVKGIATADNPAKVVVRKIFVNDNYTPISLPFDVSKENIKKSSGETLTTSGNTNRYWAFEMNQKNRADETVGSEAWTDITQMENYTGLKKATGYMFWSSDVGTIDFVTEDPANIRNLFSTNDKTIDFTVYGTKYPLKEGEDRISDGWAYIGGLNSSNFKLNNSKIDYPGTTIYVLEKDVSHLIETIDNVSYKALSVAHEDLVLAPYQPFYVQYDVVNVDEETGSSSVVEGGVWNVGENPYRTVSFGFKNSGLSFENTSFRSSQNSEPKDELRVKISKEGNDESSDHFYLSFSDDYSKSFSASKDALKLTTTSTGGFPKVWIMKDETNYSLTEYGLPLKNGRALKIGYSASEQANYTISMEVLKSGDVQTVVLVDNITGTQTNLLQHSYTFNASMVENETERLVLYVNHFQTDATKMEDNSNVYASVNDNILTVKNLSERDLIQVIDVVGRIVASTRVSGEEFSMNLTQKGLYIVNVKGVKTSTLRVRN
jgi:hypothetical protein